MGICEDVKGGRQIGVARETLTPSPVQPQTDLARPAGCVRLCLSGCWSPPCLGRAPRECSLLVPRCVPSQECHVCFLLHDSPGAWVEACVWLQVALDSPGSLFCVLWRKGSGTGLWVPLSPGHSTPFFLRQLSLPIYLLFYTMDLCRLLGRH